MKIIRPLPIADSGAFTRASTATYWDKTGTPQSAAINVPRFSYDPSDLTKPPALVSEAAATNLFLNSLINGSNLTTQSLTVTAQVYTLSFYGTGTIVLSGAFVATAIGTGATTRKTLTFTPTAGSVTFTVSGTVKYAQMETGSTSTSFIPTAGTAVTRSADVNTLGMLSLLTETDYPVIDLTSLYIIGDRIIDTAVGVHKIYESTTGVTSTVSSASNIITWAAHGLSANMPIKFSGSVPTGITAGTVYYVLLITGSANTFNISATVNGSLLGVGTSATFTSVASNNYNKPPSLNPSFWLLVGSTNKWAWLDDSVQSQTSNVDYVAAAVKIPSTSFADYVVLGNITNGTSARVVMMDPLDGMVFDRTISLISDSGILDLLSYFTEPIVRITDYALGGLPPYAGAQLSVSVAATGQTVAVGLLKVGLSKTVGSTQSGMTLGLQDYSVKSTDTFGTSSFLERTYARRMDLTVWVDNTRLDSIINLLNSYRVTPVVYIGSDGFNSSIVYGVYKDYTGGIDYTTVSTLHIEIEGMT